jgi:uncharacterized protein (DUF2236 family)
MEQEFTDRPATEVSLADSEALFARIASRVSDSRQGIFGPGSASWTVNRESAVFLGAGRAALLQLAHPWVAAALEQHSNVMARPIARFHNTFRTVYSMIFGSLGQALAAARHLHRLHSTIQGELKESTAGWPRGAHYKANEIAALRWVFATLIESAELAWSCALGPMPATMRELYYADSVKLAAFFGLPASELPRDWAAFAAYNQAMHQGDELGVSDRARAMAHRLLTGFGSWLYIPHWYRALTAEWLPPRLREEFHLVVTAADRKALVSASRRIPHVYRKLPPSIRYVGPWHQAQARLADRWLSPITMISNRFWIGQMRLPFSESANL